MMASIHRAAGLAFALLIAAPAPEAAAEIPRTIIAIYDRREDNDIRWTQTHRLAEMPLNHLGLVLDYHDVNEPLPDLADRPDVRGVVTFFRSGRMKNPAGYLAWAEAALDAGKRYAVLGDLGASEDLEGNPTPATLINRFLGKLGLANEGDWKLITYDTQVVAKDSRMVEFERPLTGIFPPFDRIRALDPAAKSFLVVRRRGDPESDSSLVIVTPRGGYAATGYTHYEFGEPIRKQWYVNPFEFFRLAFATDDLPKPDAATVSGRRIFYSHVDGDGWNNISDIAAYRLRRTVSAEVILKEVVEKYPDLPVTIGPIVADIDPAWYGNTLNLDLARRVLAPANVEAGSHTLSHPLAWNFYASGDVVAKEARFLELFGEGNNRRGAIASFLGSLFGKRGPSTAASGDAAIEGQALPEDLRPEDRSLMINPGYSTPRSYTKRPFDLTAEIEGSITYINRLLPPGKKVMLYQWSGDTTPFEAAVAMTRRAGVRNMNGGDTRFDPEYLSNAWVAPLGRQVGRERQVYASNSNENTYTDSWTDRYFGFQHLVRTMQNTESPRRLKPINVYYHMYSGEKLSSLNAVTENLDYARTQEIAPVAASTYAAIADGFYSAKFQALGENRWRVENRGALHAVRFDRATFDTVDFAASDGVIGQRHLYGSLYVELDADHPAPIIALTEAERADRPAAAPMPYLIQSRWLVRGVKADDGHVTFTAQGYGAGEMSWRMPRSGLWQIDASAGANAPVRRTVEVGADGLLATTVDGIGGNPVTVSIRFLGPR